MTTTSVLSAAAKSRGEVFTRRWVVELMLDLVEYTRTRDLANLTVVEPAVGSGAFWRVLLERLTTSLPAARQWESLNNALRGYDIEQANVDNCRALTIAHLVASGCPRGTAHALAERWLRCEDFLLATRDLRADLVVGNPPTSGSRNWHPRYSTNTGEWHRRWGGVQTSSWGSTNMG